MVDALHEKVKAEQEARMQRAIDNLEVTKAPYLQQSSLSACSYLIFSFAFIVSIVAFGTHRE